MKQFKLTLRTPEKELLDASDITSVKVITETGPIVVYANHADLTGNIRFSTLTAHSDRGEERFMLRRGTIFVDNNKKIVVVLAMAGDPIEHVKFEDAQEYLNFINQKIAEGGKGLTDTQLKYLEEEKLAISEQVKAMKK